MRTSLSTTTGIAAKLVRLCALGVAATALAGTAALASNASVAEIRTTAGAVTTDDLIWG